VVPGAFVTAESKAQGAHKIDSRAWRQLGDMESAMAERSDLLIGGTCMVTIAF
jgi:hypothetical protein